MDIKEINYGALPEVEPMRVYDYEIACGAPIELVMEQSYPEEYIIDTKKMGVLKNQGTVGCCVSCVMSSLAEVFKLAEDYGENVPEDEWKKLEDNHFINYEFSEGWAYGGLRNTWENYEGMYPSRALEEWRKRGMIPKKYFDVLKEMPDIMESVMQFPELTEKALPYAIKNYTLIEFTSVEKKDVFIKRALMQNGYGLLAVAPNYFGGCHCIMIVGWNDKTKSYKIKNSWGKVWGDKNGVGEIPKNQIQNVYVVYDKELQLPFVDVKTEDWFAKDVKNMYFAGLINGTTSTTFEPLRGTTRGEATALISRVIKMAEERLGLLEKVIQEKRKLTVDINTEIIPKTYKPLPFIDVMSTDWYYNDIQTLYSLGIINGVTDTEFKPNDNITRAQMAALITRVCELIDNKITEILKVCKKTNYISKLTTNITGIDKLLFVDVFTKDGRKEWYYDYILKACQLGILQGVSNTIFEPQRDIIRAEMAAVLNRLSKFIDTRIQFTNEAF